MIDHLIPWYLRHARHPFKDKIVGRYWGWFSKHPVWITYDGALRFKVDLHDYVQQKVFFEGYYEPNLVTWLKQALRPTDVFWDVGANVGAITLIAARKCRLVVAFEPETKARQHLEEHIQANQIGNVVVLPVALSAIDGVAPFTLGPKANSGMHSLCGRAGGASIVEVATARADSLVAQGIAEIPNVMKVDVEGAELLVFEGARELLRAPQLHAIVFEAAGDASGEPVNAGIEAILRQSGFAVSVFGRSDPDGNDTKNNFMATRVRS